MAFGYENVRPPPGELGWTLNEKAKSLRAVAHTAGPSGAFWGGNPFSFRRATFKGRVALCWDGGVCPWLGWWWEGVGCLAGVPPAPARGCWVLLSDSCLQGWSRVSLQILTNNVTGLVALK